MFMCKHCLEQFEDSALAYTLIPEGRLGHPAADMFLNKFCSKAHLQDFLHEISFQKMTYVLTRVDKQGATKQFEAATPLDLLLLVGSSKAAS